jgi:hypothetical protein
MTRTIFTYGLLAGLIIAVPTMAMIVFGISSHHSSVVVGYLVMLVGMSVVLVGVRQHRDKALGGVIRFWPALGLGLGIALVAGVLYVASWEAYLAFTHYAFADDYASAVLAAQRPKLGPAEYARLAAQMAAFKASYANPLVRFGMTFMEILPVVVIVPLASAALLRNPRFLPARARPGVA